MPRVARRGTRRGAGAELMSIAEDELHQPLSDAAIVERIVSAVMEQKLAAGAKLPEAALCDAFDSSRTISSAHPRRARRARSCLGFIPIEAHS